MINLAAGKCIPCRKTELPLTQEQIADLMFHVPQWELIERDAIPLLQRRFKFKNFSEAMEFVNKIAVIAEEERHHPLMIIEWGSVTVQWWTYAIKGLHRNDFIVAAKVNLLYTKCST